MVYCYYQVHFVFCPLNFIERFPYLIKYLPRRMLGRLLDVKVWRGEGGGDCLTIFWLFNVYMDGVVRQVNVRVLGKGLELLSANGGRFEVNQLLFADDTALVADSEKKLCRLVSNFGRVCERRKLRVNVGKGKVMSCSRYGNGDRMHVILNGSGLF